MIAPEDRGRLTQDTLDAWIGTPFAWGTADCAKLVVDHLKRFGHHVRLAKIGAYKTALGASAALRRMGAVDLTAALDAILTIWRLDAPAFAVTGDVVMLPGDDGVFDALGIYLGNGAVLAWHPDAEGLVVQNEFTMWKAAWRV
jgi:hypothetical protein